MSAPARVLLIRHAPTAATRRHAFPVDEPLDEPGRAAAAALRGTVTAQRAVTAPAQRCRQTAALAGFDSPQVDPAWSELDFGQWAGHTLTEVGHRQPEQLSAWLADPQAAPPGGEPLASLVERVRAALAGLAEEPGVTTAVFTSAGPVKAAVLAALAAPLTSLWRVDVTPCAVAVLHGHSSQWTIRSLNALPPAAGGGS